MSTAGPRLEDAAPAIPDCGFSPKSRKAAVRAWCVPVRVVVETAARSGPARREDPQTVNTDADLEVAMKEIRLEIEELEERIAPSVVGNPVPKGANPQPSGGGGHGGHNNPVPNGARPQPH
jgi:hypothetical protein